MTDLAVRSDVVLLPDPRRVIARLFVPGHELVLDTQSRATSVLSRILALPEDVVRESFADVVARYADRHRDLPAAMLANFGHIAHRIPDGPALSAERRGLLGAFFTHEYAVEAAALFNPSAVPHPDQSGLEPGQCRFVISLRAVGEGHLSSIEFRSGVVGPGDMLRLDEAGPHLELGRTGPASNDRALFVARLEEEDVDEESSRFLVGELPEVFDRDDLDRALLALAGQRLTRQGGVRLAEVARQLVEGSYEVVFDPSSSLAGRVLWPHAAAESRGLEDARFVRFEGDDGSATYRGTYTAFNGERIRPQLIETDDFRHFRLSQLAGPAATNKGLALFPRTVGGRHVALSRWDRENCSLAWSSDGRVWGEPQTIHVPTQPWEIIQTGNCGSPIETSAGWLVITHGVGPLREYSIGALLLDLDDPTRVLGGLRNPLLLPDASEREGYVPNVVYSCGAMRYGDRLLLPYGASDSSVRFAFVDLPLLLERMLSDGPPAATLAKSSA